MNVRPHLKVPSSQLVSPQVMNWDSEFNSLASSTRLQQKVLLRTPSSSLPPLMLLFKSSKQSKHHLSNLGHKRVQNLRRRFFRKTSFKHSSKISSYRKHITKVFRNSIQFNSKNPLPPNRIFLPQIDLMLCKSTDSEVELIANLHIRITNIPFRRFSNTPKS